MTAGERIGRVVRACALGMILAAVFAGGLSVALDLERMLLAGTEEFVGQFPQPAIHRESGGMGFTITTSCHFNPFDPLALLVVPVLLWMTFPGPRPIELRLIG